MKNTFYVRTAIALALGSVLVPSAQAALPTGALLNINAGVQTFDSNGNPTNVSPGSYFGMDTNGNSKIAGSEKTPLSQGPDGGIIIGVTQDTNGHASHAGAVHVGQGGIDAEWSFFGNAGMDLTTTAITSLSATTLNLSGWTVTWNGIAVIPMNTGATWSAGFSNGIANLTCTADATCGTSGDTYVLEYAATVPLGDPSGFGGVKYFLHLEGTVTNEAPTAGDVTLNNVVQDIAKTWTPAAADNNASTSGVPNTSLTCTVTSGPSHGTVSFNATCSSATYTPDAAYVGGDSFTYSADDGLDSSATDGTVTVTVLATGANLPPQASDDTASTVIDTAVSINVIANDTDEDGTVDGTAVVPTSPSTNGGTVVDNNDGTVTYTPAAGFVGTDTFTYTVDDNDGSTSSSATVTVTVQSNLPASSAGTTLNGGSYDTDNDGRTDSALPDDAAMETMCLGGCFDFVITGVTGSVDVVLPLTEALPADAGSLLVYRKYDPNTSTWRTFTATDGNEIKTAVGSGTDGTAAVCPTPGTSDDTGVSGFRSGLNPGDRCIQLTLVDNGDWDSNAVVGTVADPGGIGIYAAAAPAPVGTESSVGGGGCALSTRPLGIGAAGDWLLVGAALAGLGLFRRRVF